MSQHPKPLQVAGTQPEFEVVAIAASAGGLGALSKVLAGIPADFPPLLSSFSISTQDIESRHPEQAHAVAGRQARQGDRDMSSEPPQEDR